MGRIKNVVEKANNLKGKINPKFSLSLTNMEEIRNAHASVYEAIGCSFRFGYLQGMKAAKAEMKK